MQQQINLYQPVASSKNEPFSAVMMIVIVLVTCVLMMAFYGMLFWKKNTLQHEVTALKSQLEQTTETVEKLEATVATLTDSKKDQDRLKHLKNVFTSKQNALNELSTMVRGNNSGLSTYFSALARKNIEAIWFENIDVYSGGEQITLQGRTSDAKNIPVFVSSLNEESAFKGVSFKLFNVKKEEKDNSLYFVLQTENLKEEPLANP
ncbi:MAG: hypothetical protein OQL19_16280 [Gammaproteobacteria bacterium]|nr:hypothetical protein [Gammaproteobacteria bacterium]